MSENILLDNYLSKSKERRDSDVMKRKTDKIQDSNINYGQKQSSPVKNASLNIQDQKRVLGIMKDD